MKNKILKTITYLNVFSLMFFGSALDSVSNVPAIICAINLAWLLPFVIINREVLYDKTF